jgi:hypothetical protein
MRRRDDWSEEACEADRGLVACLDRRLLLPSSTSASERDDDDDDDDDDSSPFPRTSSSSSSSPFRTRRDYTLDTTWSEEACEADRGLVACLDRRLLLPSSTSASESCSRPRDPRPLCTTLAFQPSRSTTALGRGSRTRQQQSPVSETRRGTHASLARV